MPIKLYLSDTPINSIIDKAQENDILILPTKRALNSAISSLKEIKKAPAIITQEAFFNNILKSGSKIIADNFVKQIFIRKAIEQTKNSELILKGGFEDIKSITKLSSFIAYLIQFYQELFENRVNFDCLTKESLYSDFENEVEVLNSVYKTYEKLLNENNMVDLNSLKRSLAINKNLQYKTINIAISGLLSRYEQNALEELSELNTINIFINSKSNLPGKTASWLKQYGYKEIQVQQTADICVYKLGSKIETAAWIVETLYKEYHENKIEFEDIAVVLPDESLIEYLKLIDRELFNFAGGFSLEESIYLRFLKLILNTLSSKTSYGYTGIDMLKLKNHPFTNIKIIEDYLPVYDKSAGEAFECIKKIYEHTLISLQTASKMLLKCFHSINYQSAHYDFLSAKNVLFDEIEKLSILNKDLIAIEDTGKNMLKFIDNVLSSKSYADVGIGKVSVIGVLESRFLSRNLVVMPSLNEGIMPKEVKKDLFLNTRIRSGCGLPTYKDRENLQKSYFSNIINNAKKAYLAYTENDTENISKFLSDLMFEKGITADKRNSSTDYIFEKSEKVKIKEPKNGIKKDESADNKIKTITLSAHSINDFKECPYRFYLKYIKHIPQEKDFSDESPFEVGRVIHDVMEKLYENKRPINNKKELSEKFEKIFKDITLTSLYYAVNPKERLKLEYMLYKIKHSDFFEKEALNTAVKIETEKEFECVIESSKISGRIDRIDYHEDGFEVIDYKTGNTSTIKKIDKSYNTQLPLYAYVVEKESGLECLSMKYYSFKDMRFVLLDYVMENRDVFENDIRETIKQIKTIDFFQKNKKSCIYCLYKEICRP